MAAEIAYRFLFAIFPLMLFVFATLGVLGRARGFGQLSSFLYDGRRLRINVDRSST